MRPLLLCVLGTPPRPAPHPPVQKVVFLITLLSFTSLESGKADRLLSGFISTFKSCADNIAHAGSMCLPPLKPWLLINFRTGMKVSVSWGRRLRSHVSVSSVLPGPAAPGTMTSPICHLTFSGSEHLNQLVFRPWTQRCLLAPGDTDLWQKPKAWVTGTVRCHPEQAGPEPALSSAQEWTASDQSPVQAAGEQEG